MAKPASRVLRTGGLHFDGVDDYVLVARSPSLDITSAITFALMINIPQRATGIKGIVNRWGWWGPWLIEINYDYNILVFKLGRSSTEHKSMDISYSNLYSMWNHLAFTGVSGGYMRIYLNGTKVAEKAFPYSIGTDGDKIYIGRHAWGNPVNAVIGYLLIYNRALSDAEIKTIYERDELIKDGLVLYLDFSEYEGNIAYDKSGYGNHGTIYGASWVVKKALRVLPKAR
ncbi:MAG: LamG domain-containing protein [Candidatus Methanomethylicia archaeon]